MTDCIFCSIVAGQSPCHKVWEDEEHLAFLSIFPNMDGLTVVITKQHYDSYAFQLPDDVLSKLAVASAKVGRQIDAAFPDVGRTGMVFEGFGVNHIHAKLYPLHGTGDTREEWKQIEFAKPTEYLDLYPGYISTHDCGRADDAKLAEIAEKIRSAGQA